MKRLVKLLGDFFGGESLFVAGLLVLVVVAFIGCVGRYNPDVFQAPQPGYQDTGTEVEP